MPIKNRLLASALIPVMAGCFAGYTAKAASLPVTYEVAQAQPLSPEEEMLLKRKQKEAAGETNDGAAGQRRQKQDAEPAGRPQREAAPQPGNDAPPPKRQKPAAEPAQDAAPAGRPQREAAPQPGNDAPPQKRPQPAAEPAQGSAPAAKPPRESAPQPGNDAPPQKRPQPAAEPAQGSAPAAKPPREAVPQPGTDAPPQKRPQPAAEPAQGSAPAAKPPREAVPQPGADVPPQKRPQPAAEPAQGSAPAAKPPREAAPQPGTDVPPQKRPQPAAEPAQGSAPAAKPPREAAPQPGTDAPPQKRPQPAAEPAQGSAPAVKPPREAAPQPGTDASPVPPRQQPGATTGQGGVPPVNPQAGAVPPLPGGEGQPSRPPRADVTQPGQPQNGAQAEPAQRPVPPIEDRRTERERKAEAADPSKTDDTVVLPVDNGAAVLDSDKDADNRGGQTARDERRRERERLREQGGNNSLPPPRDDAEAQRRAPQVRQEDIEASRREQGRRRNDAPDFLGAILGPILQNGVNPGGYDAPRRFDDRTVYETDDGIVVRSDERRRLGRDADETYYEDLARGRVRETIVRQDGGRIVTIYNRYGDVIQRSRFTRDGREFLLSYAPEADQEQRPPVFRDPGDDLPPMRLRIPVRDYIIDTSSDPDRDYYDFLAEPPVEQVERVYTIDEVKYSARLRDKVRRIDLDTITFATGSADVPMAQAKTVRSVAEAIQKVLARDPGETFLIEGHTDAVGSDESNLVLSDQRAESVANLLTDVYGIPPENLTTQGYGERYLKVRTEAAEQQNRRVTIRRVTSLVRPAAAGK